MRKLLLFLLVCSCATASGAPRHLPEPSPALPGMDPPKLVVTGRVEAIATDVDGLVREVRARTQAAGGQVANEEVAARDEARASLRLRLPPPQVTPFVDWLATRAEVRARELGAEDVSRAYVDQELALRNLRTTMERLEALAARGGKLSDVLEIERELTRVRGEIERLEGEHRLLGDRVALAVIDLSISGAANALAPRAMFQLTPSAAVLAFASGRAARAGAGLTLMFARSGSVELQLFPARGQEPRAFMVTLQSAAYSDFLGGGRRRFLNPYLGLLVGGAELDGDGAFTAGASAGVELYRGPRLLVDLQGRAQVLLFSKDEKRPAETALQGVLGVGMPF